VTLPSWRDWLFSVKTFAASMLALFIALSLDLPRPYWAMAAVYVVSNPLAGATSSRGLYRALGTLLGAIAAVVFVPLFVDSPVLLSLAISLWTGTLLFISMLDRTARSYVFMLAGYTLPLIALPTVDNPSTIFDVAVARSEEIILGITCASLVSAIVFPASVGTLLGARISLWLTDAGSWADDILCGYGASPATPLKRQKLATDVIGLDLSISQLGHDAETRDIVRHARELRGRMLMLLPLFSSLADRLHALKARDGSITPELDTVLRDVADYMNSRKEGAPSKQAEALSIELERLHQHDHPHSWNGLLYLSALQRLKEIVDLWQDCLSLSQHIRTGRQLGRWRPVFRHRRVVASSHHYDYALLLFSAGSVVLATLLACGLWIATGWESGAGMVAMVAVGCSFFATLDEPAPLLKSMMVWTVVSIGVSFVYLFGILPMVTSFEMLVVVFAPPFLLLGLLVPKPQYFLMALLTCVNTASYVALQDRYSADFVSLIGGGGAAATGIAFALVWTLVTKPFGAEFAARRLVKAGWRDLADAAAGTKRDDFERLSGRVLDRLGQLVPRLTTIESPNLQDVDGFADVRLVFNILALQKERIGLRAASNAGVNSVLSAIAEHYKDCIEKNVAVAAPASLLHLIDETLRLLVRSDADMGMEAIDALVGVRRVLFPNALAPAEASIDRTADSVNEGTRANVMMPSNARMHE
jgi:uncharacterized membrane protein YccC